MSVVFPKPVSLRPVTDKSVGTTAFFRNRPLFDTLLDCLKQEGKKQYTVLFHACSVGAEVYSFIIRYLLKGYDEEFQLSCFATDIEQGFVSFAEEAQYPFIVLNGLLGQEKKYFCAGQDSVRLSDDVKKYIKFLPAQNFSCFSSRTSFDVVVVLNALIYVPGKSQKKIFEKIAKYNSRYLVTTAFHADRVKKDLKNNSYVPILNNQELIHESWVDRRINMEKEITGTHIYADWRLPPFSKSKDYEYKYCAIFEKNRFFQKRALLVASSE